MSTHHDVPPICRIIPDVACFSSPPIVAPTSGLAPMPTELVRFALRAPSPTCIRNCDILCCQLQNVPDNRAPAHQPVKLSRQSARLVTLLSNINKLNRCQDPTENRKAGAKITCRVQTYLTHLQPLREGALAADCLCWLCSIGSSSHNASVEG